MSKLAICCMTMLLMISTVFAAPAPPVTDSPSAILMDGSGTVLYEKNSHQRLPPASVTKTMTLLLAVEAVEEGRALLTDSVTVSENAWRQGGSQIWLEPGEAMSLRELLTAVAVVSANDAAVAVMEHLYGSETAAVAAMNERASALGLADTHFANVNGLPAPLHYMSAYDTAQISREAVRHPLYMELCSIKEYWLRNGKNWLVNTNKLLWWYKGADGLKTGWTQEAQYCFAGTAKREGLRLIAVVFATAEPRSHLRESMKLLDWGFANYTALPVVERGSAVERLAVSRGMEKEVRLVAAADLTLLLGRQQSKNIQKKVVTVSSAAAPIQAGTKYGELIVLQDGREAARVDLIAEKNIERANFLRSLQHVMTALLNLAK